MGDNAVDPYHHCHTRFHAKIHHWLRAHPPLIKTLVIRTFSISKILCFFFIEQQVGKI